jgi:hypothetical protein
MRVYWDMAFFAWKLRTMVDGFSLLMYPREGKVFGKREWNVLCMHRRARWTFVHFGCAGMGLR